MREKSDLSSYGLLYEAQYVSRHVLAGFLKTITDGVKDPAPHFSTLELVDC